MAKIRGVKPDTWTDEKFVAVSPLARLLFIGMWNHACDNGHLEDSPLQLKMRILPADNCDPATLLRELVDAGLVSRQGGYLKVPTLPSHQKPDKRFLTFCPRCAHDEECAYPEVKPTGRTASTPRGHVENPTSTPSVHTDDCDCDGECEGDNNTRSPAAAEESSPSADAEGESDEESALPISAELVLVEPTPLLSARPDDGFDDWWQAYPRKVGKGQAAKAYRAARKKATPEALFAAVTAQAPLLMARGSQYCPHPATWLNGERWRDEPAELRSTDPKRYTRADWEHLANRADERSLP